tara:strand:- start:14864 stop:15232 length:369 start_codon:yes stop_codon:yes gene_type:complete
MTDDIHKVELKVSEINVIVDRLEVSILKLLDVSQTLEKSAIQNTTKINAFEKQVEIIHDRISDFKKDILDEFKEIIKQEDDHRSALSERLERLERWRWFVIGASAALGIIAANITKILMAFK